MKWYDKQKKVCEEKLDAPNATSMPEESEETLHKNIDTDDEYIIDFEPKVYYDDLTSLDDSEQESTSQQNTSIDKVAFDTTEKIIEAEEFKTSDVERTIITPDFTEEEKLEMLCEEAKAKKKVTTSTILKDTQLLGNLTVDGLLNVYGDIIGDIHCTNLVCLYGTVEGDISCSDLVVNNATVVGNITCTNAVTIYGSSSIKGNITAESLKNEGSIIGDLNIQHSVALTNSANVEGMINAQVFEAQKGTLIKGFVTIVNASASLEQS